MLVHLLAEFVHHIGALVALLDHLEAAVHSAIERDRAAKERQIDAFDEHEHADKDQTVNQGFCADGHGAYSAATGSKRVAGRS